MVSDDLLRSHVYHRTGGALPDFLRAARAPNRLRRVRPVYAADFPDRQLLLLQPAHRGALPAAAGRRVLTSTPALLRSRVREQAADSSRRVRIAAAGVSRLFTNAAAE